MAGISTQHKNTYLDTYTGGNQQAAGLDPRGLNPAQGLAAAGDVTTKAGVELGHNIQEWAQTYNQLLAQRYARDEDLRASELFRDMRTRDAQLLLEDADNLYYKTKDGMAQLKEDFLKDSKLGPQVAGYIFDKHAGRHLDWASQHMLTQMKAAEKKSRHKKSTSNVTMAASMAPTKQNFAQIIANAEAINPGQEDDETVAARVDEIQRGVMASVTAGAASRPFAVDGYIVDAIKFLNQAVGPNAAFEADLRNNAILAASLAVANKSKEASAFTRMRNARIAAASSKLLEDSSPENQQRVALEFNLSPNESNTAVKNIQTTHHTSGAWLDFVASGRAPSKAEVPLIQAAVATGELRADVGKVLIDRYETAEKIKATGLKTQVANGAKLVKFGLAGTTADGAANLGAAAYEKAFNEAPPEGKKYLSTSEGIAAFTEEFAKEQGNIPAITAKGQQARIASVGAMVSRFKGGQQLAEHVGAGPPEENRDELNKRPLSAIGFK